jgi:hypothetical protein
MSLSSLPIEENYVGFEFFTTVVMKSIIFWDIILFITIAVKTSNPEVSSGLDTRSKSHHNAGQTTVRANPQKL